MYTIGIKRRFFFGFKKFYVKGHRMEVDVAMTSFDGRKIIAQISPRLVLNLKDESIVLISNIDQKTWKLYRDFNKPKEVQPWPAESPQKNSTEPLPT